MRNPLDSMRMTSRAVLGAAGLALGLAVLGPSLSGRQGAGAQDPAPKPAGGQPAQTARAADQPLSKDERARIAAQVLAHPDVTASTQGQKVRALRVSKENGDTKTVDVDQAKHRADVLLYNDSTGKCERVTFNTRTNEVVAREPLRGAPSPTEDELDEAERIIRADVELNRILDSGGHLTGGFLAAAPAHAPEHHRYVQMQLLSPDRRQMMRVVVVDLSRGVLASTSRR